LGLIFDRHQGLVVQVPAVVVGVLGLWAARKIAPWSVAATVGAVAVLIYLNATYVGVPYGGTALAGRFSWSDMALLMAWVPALVAGIHSIGRLWVLGAVAIVAWVLQAVPVLDRSHAYYNAQINGAPWDPSSYPGWWGRLDRILPELVPKGPLWGSPAWALPVAVVLTVTIGVAVQFGLRRPIGPASVRAGSAVALVIVVAVLAATVPPRRPAHPLVFAGSSVGSPVVTAAQAVTVGPIPLQRVGAGTFTITTGFQLTGTATVAASCTGGTAVRPGPSASSATRSLPAGPGLVTLTLRCPDSVLWYRTEVQPASRLDIDQVTVRKA
jgi:hypothetical protein